MRGEILNKIFASSGEAARYLIMDFAQKNGAGGALPIQAQSHPLRVQPSQYGFPIHVGAAHPMRTHSHPLTGTAQQIRVSPSMWALPYQYGHIPPLTGAAQPKRTHPKQMRARPSFQGAPVRYGGEENRTPVRKPFLMTFYVRRTPLFSPPTAPDDRGTEGAAL